LKPDVWKKNNSGAQKESIMNAKKLSLQAQKMQKTIVHKNSLNVDENSSKEWHPKMKTRPK